MFLQAPRDAAPVLITRTLFVPTVVVEGKFFCTETVNASPDIVILCPACLPRPRSLQISDLSEHNLLVRIEGGVVRIEGGVVKKCKSVVKTLKTVVKNKLFIPVAMAGTDSRVWDRRG
jgi:hypothetical protein